MVCGKCCHPLCETAAVVALLLSSTVANGERVSSLQTGCSKHHVPDGEPEPENTTYPRCYSVSVSDRRAISS